MSGGSNEADLRGELADDDLDPARLAEIAYDHPELRAEVAVHPAAYDGLLQWLGELGDKDVDAALARRDDDDAGADDDGAEDDGAGDESAKDAGGGDASADVEGSGDAGADDDGSEDAGGGDDGADDEGGDDAGGDDAGADDEAARGEDAGSAGAHDDEELTVLAPGTGEPAGGETGGQETAEDPASAADDGEGATERLGDTVPEEEEWQEDAASGPYLKAGASEPGGWDEEYGPADEDLTGVAPVPASFDPGTPAVWQGPQEPGLAGPPDPPAPPAGMPHARRGPRPGLIFAAMALVAVLAVAGAVIVRAVSGGGTTDGEYVSAGVAICPKAMDTFYSASLPQGGSVCVCGAGSPSLIVWLPGDKKQVASFGLPTGVNLFRQVTQYGQDTSGSLTYCGDASNEAHACVDGIGNTLTLGDPAKPALSLAATSAAPCAEWRTIANRAGLSGQDTAAAPAETQAAAEPEPAGPETPGPGDPGAYGVPLPQDTAADQVRYLSQIIEKSKAARATLVDTVEELNTCSSSDYRASLSRIESVTQNRQELLDALATTPVDKIPDGSHLLERLTASLTASLNADKAFERWTSQIIASGCPAGQADREQAVAYSGDATAAKTDFCDAWNSEIVPQFHVPEVTNEKL